MANKASVVWQGLAEYRAQLTQMPAACTNEAARVVEGGVNSAFVRISTVYGQHRVTGTLQDRLKIKPLKRRGELTTGLVLTSGSPIAWLFDYGSEARHYTGTDKRGRKYTNALRGRMPPNHIFVKTVIKTRREVVDKLKAIVLRHGATSVTEAA